MRPRQKPPRMAKMRLQIYFSVATAVYPHGRHCKLPQSGGRWQLYHVVTTNDIPANRMGRRKRRVEHCKGKHAIPIAILEDSILGTSFPGLGIDMLYLCMTVSSNEALVLHKVKLETESKQSSKHKYACNID